MIMAATRRYKAKTRETSNVSTQGNEDSNGEVLLETAYPKTVEVAEARKAKKSNKKCSGNEQAKDKPYTCQVCNRKLLTKDTFRTHMYTHPEVRYSCTICGEEFARDKFRRSHELTHRTTPVFKCQYCEKIYSQKKNLRGHEKLHMGDKIPCRCNVCGDWFKTKVSLLQHIQELHKEYDIETDPAIEGIQDNEVTSRKWRRKIKTMTDPKEHEENQTEPDPFICKQCGGMFSEELTYIVHEMAHNTVDGKFQCKFCDKQYTFMDALKSHVSAHFPEKGYACGECGFICKSRNHLFEHKKSQHPDDFGLYYDCEVCGKSFSSKLIKDRHVNTEHFNKKHRCKYCEEAFTVKARLRAHNFKCNGGKSPHIGEYCDKTIHTPSALNTHRKRHGQVKAGYTCKTCGWKFVYKCFFRYHLRKHQNERKEEQNRQRGRAVEKNYRCRVCARGFDEEHEQKEHERTHGTTSCEMERKSHGREFASGEILNISDSEAVESNVDMPTSSGGQKFTESSPTRPPVHANDENHDLLSVSKNILKTDRPLPYEKLDSMSVQMVDSSIGNTFPGNSDTGTQSTDTLITRYPESNVNQDEVDIHKEKDHLVDCVELDITSTNSESMSRNLVEQREAHIIHEQDETKSIQTEGVGDVDRPALLDEHATSLADACVTMSGTVQDKDITEHMPSDNSNKSTGEDDTSIKDIFPEQNGNETSQARTDANGLRSRESNNSYRQPDTTSASYGSLNCSGMATVFRQKRNIISNPEMTVTSTSPSCGVSSISKPMAALTGRLEDLLDNTETQGDPDAVNVTGTNSDSETDEASTGTFQDENRSTPPVLAIDHMMSQMHRLSPCDGSGYDMDIHDQTNEISQSQSNDLDDRISFDIVTSQRQSVDNENVNIADGEASDERMGHGIEYYSRGPFCKRSSKCDRKFADEQGSLPTISIDRNIHSVGAQNADLLVNVEFGDSDTAEDDRMILTFRCNSPDPNSQFPCSNATRIKKEIMCEEQMVNSKRTRLKHSDTRLRRSSNDQKDSSIECIVLDSDDDSSPNDMFHQESVSSPAVRPQSEYVRKWIQGLEGMSSVAMDNTNTDRHQQVTRKRKRQNKQPGIGNKKKAGANKPGTSKSSVCHIRGTEEGSQFSFVANNRETTSGESMTSGQDGQSVAGSNTGIKNENESTTCDSCSIDYSNLLLYLVHRGFHGPDGTFHCSVCDKMFQDSVKFNIHISGHPLRNIKM
ncbi:uncharacterized protein [Ptychodera flava]|uniref:uncharacterized protein n=1 Tax=Ptychodera flava TaxID=63121 RepID=UPI00396A9306